MWRRNLPTHFRRAGAPPPRAWACRSPDRLRCLNGVADAALAGTGVDVLDDWALAAVRSDCTKDNRHYTKANCGPTMAARLLAAVAPAD